MLGKNMLHCEMSDLVKDKKVNFCQACANKS